MKPGMLLAGLALAAACASAGAMTATGSPDSGAWTVDMVTRATADANVPALAEAYRHASDPVTRALAAMALERIHLNLDKSSEDARVCERSLIDTAPDIALFCARFANGNLRLAQGPAVADPAELDIIRRFTGKVPAGTLQKMQDYVDAHRNVAPMQVDLPADGATIALVRRPRDPRGLIEVQANGQTTRLAIGTGAGPLVLDEASARRLGVRMLDLEGRARGFLSTAVAVRYGVLDRMQVGPLVFTHVPVEVAPGRERILGIDLLRQLGAFRLSRDALLVYGPRSPRPACLEPMLVSSNPWGNSLRVVVALPIDGQLHNTLLASGSDFYLSGNQQAADELAVTDNHRMRTRDLGAFTHHARVGRATAEVVISGQPIHMTFGVFTDAHLPWPYMLGGGALSDMDFYLDFRQHHTCLLLHDHLH